LPEPVIVAIIALSGAFVGAILQAALAGRFEKSKFVRDNQRDAYQDFLVALGNLSVFKPNTPNHDQEKSMIAQTRCRIALFGSQHVVQLLAHLFENTVTFDKPMDQMRLYEVILAMRRDSIGSKDRGIKVDLFSLVFASAPKEGQ